MPTLENTVALVTGASRGVGRGIATGLASAGATVYATGRSIEQADLEPPIRSLVCDHTGDDAVRRLFDRIADEQSRLHILVNNVWGGYERMVEDGRFTWTDPFWEQPLWRWEAMMNAGVRAAFVASQRAAHVMVPAHGELIVNISHWAAQTHAGNLLYGVSKAATDKLTADAARELRDHEVTMVSLYPGLVRTEAVLAAGVFDLTNSESPESWDARWRRWRLTRMSRAGAAKWSSPPRSRSTTVSRTPTAAGPAH